MTPYILDAVLLFKPFLILALLVSSVFALPLHGYFIDTSIDTSTARSWRFSISVRIRGFVRALSFLSMFGIFGIVTAYFMSLGLHEENLQFVNPMVETFAAPLIALLTAGVAYFARTDSKSENSVIVPAGVICFLIVSCLTYTTLLLSVKAAAA